MIILLVTVGVTVQLYIYLVYHMFWFLPHRLCVCPSEAIYRVYYNYVGPLTQTTQTFYNNYIAASRLNENYNNKNKNNKRPVITQKWIHKNIYAHIQLISK